MRHPGLRACSIRSFVIAQLLLYFWISDITVLLAVTLYISYDNESCEESSFHHGLYIPAVCHLCPPSSLFWVHLGTETSFNVHGSLTGREVTEAQIRDVRKTCENISTNHLLPEDTGGNRSSCRHS